MGRRARRRQEARERRTPEASFQEKLNMLRILRTLASGPGVCPRCGRGEGHTRDCQLAKQLRAAEAWYRSLAPEERDALHGQADRPT